MSIANDPVARIYLDIADEAFKRGLREANKEFKNSATEWNSRIELLQKGWRVSIGLMGDLWRLGKQALNALAKETGSVGAAARTVQKDFSEIRKTLLTLFSTGDITDQLNDFHESLVKINHELNREETKSFFKDMVASFRQSAGYIVNIGGGFVAALTSQFHGLKTLFDAFRQDAMSVDEYMRKSRASGTEFVSSMSSIVNNLASAVSGVKSIQDQISGRTEKMYLLDGVINPKSLENIPPELAGILDISSANGDERERADLKAYFAGIGKNGPKKPKKSKPGVLRDFNPAEASAITLADLEYGVDKSSYLLPESDVKATARSVVSGPRSPGEMSSKINEDEVAQNRRMNALRERYQKDMQQMKDWRGQLAEAGVALGGAIGQGFASGIANMMSGGEGFLKSLKKMIGEFLVQLGTMLMATAGAAMAGALLSKVFPPSTPILDPTGQAYLVAGATMAVGAGLVATGTAMSGAAGRAGTRSPQRVTPVGGGGRGAGAPGFSGFGDLGGGGGNTTLIVNFNGPVSNPRRTAREFGSVLQSSGVTVGG